jgi:hypothetical protein
VIQPKVRSAGTRFIRALIAPLFYAWSTGNLRSNLSGRAVNRDGRPVPFLTYPAIAFLEGKDFSLRRILEWGSGQSTLWWAQRALSIRSFEESEKWAECLRPQLPPNASITVVKSWDLHDFNRELLGGEPFDVIVIDGCQRSMALAHSVARLAPRGAIIVDNTNTPLPDYAVLLTQLKSEGFSRIDFHGFGPISVREWCTSLFYRDNCFLLTPSEEFAERRL